MIKDNGLLWVIQRTYYEFLRKIKWHNWKFKSRCWKKDEFRLWLKPSISSDPDRYYKYWINNRPLYFFNPKDREKYSITLRNLIGNKECNKLVEKADGIGKGNFSFFSSKNIKL